MNINDKILVCNEHPYNGKWFYISNGIKRWITSIEAAIDNNIDYSSIETVPVDVISKYPEGKLPVKNSKSINDITNTLESRAYFAKDLSGYGIEFGAATSPTYLPDCCIVEYADFFQIDEGCNKEYTGDFVQVKYSTGLSEMAGINNDSLDFIIACHVIEHVPQTILALECCYDRLKKGGTVFMAIPHKEYTFDVLRPLTTIEHFILDYTDYIKERDLLHVVDHVEHGTEYEAGQKGIKAERVNIFPLLNRFVNGEKIDIHYHTFIEENFTRLLDYFNANVAQWSKTEVIPRIPFEGSNEFYVKLTK